jgi:hypothetical protein
MTVTIDLRPEIEARLTAQAAAKGVPVEDYIQQLIERETLRPNLHELLTPLRKEYKESGISETELDEIIKRERRSMWEEKNKRS